MQLVHAGFDKLDLSVMANVSPALFAALEAARDEAEDKRTDVPFSYGGTDFDILPHGGNGYRFILRMGAADAHWFIKKPNAKDPWGIRISVGSTMLATQGLSVVRDHLDKTLARLGILYEPHQISIARADFCVDILAPGFELSPERFVIHSHTNRADYHAEPEDKRSNGKSGLYTSVTVGKSPGRQVIIYDKRREVIERKKPIWWDIWNANRMRQDMPQLDPEDRSLDLYRIEVRAGKDLLKDRWQIRTWEQFDAQFGDVVAEAFDKIRYCEPDPADSNRARWPLHPIWALAASICEENLLGMRTYLDPEHVKYVHREEHMRLILAQIIGNSITLAALDGIQEDGLEDYLGFTLADRMANAIRAEPERFGAKLEAAAGRYRFEA
ncbi:hypothetical protein SAMN06297129_0704 [Pseudooceanicola antarcticus]|uniref:Replication initiation factor n=3 Tax=Pseudooceanicola antarcticus TaxID=1247613 RepID=A0A285HZI8_9RHOB|nr:hypothetical protein CVM39_12290 [Pseudooceanicola antarcticus]SNY40236.1 hypothetical protein SAMN06297129_0704 [Pseudooceanicola antarcticus]